MQLDLAAGWGKLHGVGEQVQERPLHLLLVDGDRLGLIRAGELQCDTRCLTQWRALVINPGKKGHQLRGLPKKQNVA